MTTNSEQCAELRKQWLPRALFALGAPESGVLGDRLDKLLADSGLSGAEAAKVLTTPNPEDPALRSPLLVILSSVIDPRSERISVHECIRKHFAAPPYSWREGALAHSTDRYGRNALFYAVADEAGSLSPSHVRTLVGVGFPNPLVA